MIISQVLGEPLSQATKSGSLALNRKELKSLKEVKAILFREIHIQRQSMGHVGDQTCTLSKQSKSWKLRVAPRCGSNSFFLMLFYCGESHLT